MPNHQRGVLLPTMSLLELSRVRTEFERRRILTAVPPHPVQTNRHPATHRNFGYAPVPAHRQAYVPTPPVRVVACGRLRSLHQQVAQ
jgi:hypothetical protein